MEKQFTQRSILFFDSALITSDKRVALILQIIQQHPWVHSQIEQMNNGML